MSKIFTTSKNFLEWQIQSRYNFYDKKFSALKYYKRVIWTEQMVKSNRPYLRPSKSSHDLGVVKNFEFCAHFKAADKTQSCFALDTEHQYWTVTLQSRENFND